MFSPTRITLKAGKAPDCLLGVVTQPTDSRLSETIRCHDSTTPCGAIVLWQTSRHASIVDFRAPNLRDHPICSPYSPVEDLASDQQLGHAGRVLVIQGRPLLHHDGSVPLATELGGEGATGQCQHNQKLEMHVPIETNRTSIANSSCLQLSPQ